MIKVYRACGEIWRWVGSVSTGAAPDRHGAAPRSNATLPTRQEDRSLPTALYVPR